MLRPMLMFISGFAALLLAAPSLAQNDCEPSSNAQRDQSSSPAGEDCFIFTRWRGPDIPVLLYVPPQVDQKTAPIAIIMHGTRRDPDRYREQWMGEADKRGFVVVAPEFSKASFPRANGYNLGAMRDPKTREWRDRELWSYSAIEGVFDAVVERLGSEQSGYTLYGHSAGSQFVHRSLFFSPGARAKRYLAANAGWYTFPNLETPFPFGVGDTDLDEEDFRDALAKDVVILLGNRDNDPDHSSLNRSEGAMKQGAHRFARGKAFFAAAQGLARRNGWQFGWSLREVDGVAHSNGDMAKQVSDLIE